MKKIILTLLILSCSAVYIYKSHNESQLSDIIKNRVVEPSTEDTTPKTASTSEYISPYLLLSDSDKKIIDTFALKNKEEYGYLLYNSPNGKDEEAKSGISIKYKDNKTVALAISNGKGGQYLNVYDVNTLMKLNKNQILLEGNFIDTKNYLIVIGDIGIVYYKKGASDFILIPNSKLETTKETYTKTTDGPYAIGEYSFDEFTKTVTVSVFKSVFADPVNNPKTRVAKFKLE